MQLDKGSAQKINSPKHIIATHETAARTRAPNTISIIVTFDNTDFGKYFCEIDGVRYPKVFATNNSGENDYLDQNRDLKIFYTEYFVAGLLNLFRTYPGMKKYYPIEVIDLRFEFDHIARKKIQLIEEYRNNPINARLFAIFIRHRNIKMTSDADKIIENQVI